MTQKKSKKPSPRLQTKPKPKKSESRLNLPLRPRRLRRSESARRLVNENTLLPSDLIQPLFVMDGKKQRQAISSMPGQSRLSIDELVKTAAEAYELGIPAVALFPVIEDSLKDKMATESANPNGLLPRAIQALKAEVPELIVITDVAMDPYSSDGHDGYVNDQGEIENDITVRVLCEMAVAQAQAGADWVAPSDMMDGRVAAIREALDLAGQEHVCILAYSAKYASAFYGPFRDALDSAPRHGDKKTYQMNPANSREAVFEAELDMKEGADIVMIKPALPYLDVIREISKISRVPVAAYHVSGEYSMLKAAAAKGWLDGDRAMAECLLSIKRAGADMILTYAALEWARAFKKA